MGKKDNLSTNRSGWRASGRIEANWSRKSECFNFDKDLHLARGAVHTIWNILFFIGRTAKGPSFLNISNALLEAEPLINTLAVKQPLE